MDITERLKEIVLNETNIDVNINSRKREVIEIRALYFKLLKEYNPFLTLEKIGNTVEKNHATVIHSLNKYDMYENYNNQLRVLKKTIINQIEQENILNTEDKEQLKLQVKNKCLKISELEIKLEQSNLRIKQMEKAKYEYKIIENLNQLMIQTTGTDKQELINIRLQAFYDMNKQR